MTDDPSSYPCRRASDESPPREHAQARDSSEPEPFATGPARLAAQEPVLGAVDIKLVPYGPVWSAIVFSLFFCLLVIGVQVSQTRSIIPALFLAGFAFMAVLGWRQVIWAPRVHADAEGFTVRTYGLDSGLRVFRWSDVEYAIVEERRLARAGLKLHLVVKRRPGAASFPAGSDVVDLALGVARRARLDAALDAYRPTDRSTTG